MKRPGWVAGATVAMLCLCLSYLGFNFQSGESDESIELVRIPRSNLSGRNNWFWQQRAYPIGGVPVGARLRASLAADRIRPSAFSPATVSGADAPWTQIGPAGFDSKVEPTWGRQSGRVRAIAIDPTNSSRIFLGTATGGVWRSTDGAASWTPVTDNQDTLSIGSVAIDPANPNTIYVGTGEGPAGAYYSVGILKSTDGGDTWTRLASETFNRHAIAELLVSPTDSSVVLACATEGSHQPGTAIARDGNRSGIFRSTDGGTTFTQTRSGNCQDLIASPAGFNNQFASLIEVQGVGMVGESDGIYRSTDGGQTWEQVTTAGAPRGAKRLNMGISADGMTLYAGGKDSADMTHIWKSTDGGANWTMLAGAPDYCESQCNYDNDVIVSPANANHAYFAGIPFYRTLDGGMTFGQLGASNDSQPRGNLHVDHHILAFDPSNSDTLYLGNDGGIYRSTNISTPGDIANPGPTWTSLTGTSVGTIQFYDLRLHPSNPDVMLGGVQDNGTQVRSTAGGNVWTEQCGGDGSSSLIDHANPNIMYCSFAFTGGESVGIMVSENSGDTFTVDRSLPKGQDRTNFVTPLAMDPVTSTTIYAGTQRLYRSTNSGMNWAPIGPDDLTGGGDATISAVEIAPSNGMVIWVTTSDGLVQVSTDGGMTFTNATKAPLPGRYATGVAIHPTDPNTAYVGFSGFDDGTPDATGHIFRTTDGGAAWTNITGNLPDVPVNAITVRPDSPNTVYAGTDVGLFGATVGASQGASLASFDPVGTAAPSWVKFTGLPNAAISRIRVNSGRVVVATYGRSAWSMQMGTAPAEHFLYLPFLVGNMQEFTGLAFTNNSQGTAQLSLEARAADGSLKMYPQNPAAASLGASAQTARLASEFFNLAQGADQDGWVRVGSNVAEVASFFQFGNGLGGSNMTKLDGGVAFYAQSQTLYFTRLYDGMGTFPAAGGPLDATTRLSVANPNNQTITLRLRLFGADGQQVGSDVMRELNAYGCLIESLSALFGQSAVSNGFVRVDVTGPGAVGFETVELPQAVLGFNASTGNSENTSYSAQLAHGTLGTSALFTSGKLVNVSDQTRMITITGVNQTNQPLGQTMVTLNANESFQMDLGTALNLGPSSVAAVAGSLRVEADGPGVIGDVVFGEANQVRYAAALPFQTRLLTRAVFNHVANTSTGMDQTRLFTGLAFQNPQVTTTDIAITVFTAAGQQMGTRTLNLEAGNRISELLAALVPETAGQEGGYIVIQATQPVVAQLIFGNFSLDYLSAVPPTVFQ